MANGFRFDLADLREKAERSIVYPLNRDECLALIDGVEMLLKRAIAWEVAAALYQEEHTDHEGYDGCAACHAFERAARENHEAPEPDHFEGNIGANIAGGRYEPDSVLGFCPHGVDLDRAFCPEGCRV